MILHLRLVDRRDYAPPNALAWSPEKPPMEKAREGGIFGCVSIRCGEQAAGGQDGETHDKFIRCSGV